MPTTVDREAHERRWEPAGASQIQKNAFDTELDAFFVSLRAQVDDIMRATEEDALSEDPAHIRSAAAIAAFSARIEEEREQLDASISRDINTRRQEFAETAKQLKKGLKALAPSKSPARAPSKTRLLEPDYCKAGASTHLLSAGNGIVIREEEVSSMMCALRLSSCFAL